MKVMKRLTMGSGKVYLDYIQTSNGSHWADYYSVCRSEVWIQTGSIYFQVQTLLQSLSFTGYGPIIFLSQSKLVNIKVDTVQQSLTESQFRALNRNNKGAPRYLLWHMGAICCCQKPAQHATNVLPGCCYGLLPQGTDPS